MGTPRVALWQGHTYTIKRVSTPPQIVSQAAAISRMAQRMPYARVPGGGSRPRWNKARFDLLKLGVPQANPGHIPPATLPGTKKNFSIQPEQLIELAKKTLYDDDLGRKNSDVLAPDFKFEFPIVKLDKKKYLDAIRTFDFYAGFPNYDQNAYDWRVDHYEPQRVWFTVRVSATHTGTLKIFKLKYKPTGKKVYGAPEAFSITFNEQGKVTSITGGYVIDNRLGNGSGLGGLYGILQGIDVFVPHPRPGTLGWKVGIAVDTGVNLVVETLHFFTLGLFRAKNKVE